MPAIDFVEEGQAAPPAIDFQEEGQSAQPNIDFQEEAPIPTPQMMRPRTGLRPGFGPTMGSWTSAIVGSRPDPDMGWSLRRPPSGVSIDGPPVEPPTLPPGSTPTVINRGGQLSADSPLVADPVQAPDISPPIPDPSTYETPATTPVPQFPKLPQGANLAEALQQPIPGLGSGPVGPPDLIPPGKPLSAPAPMGKDSSEFGQGLVVPPAEKLRIEEEIQAPNLKLPTFPSVEEVPPLPFEPGASMGPVGVQVGRTLYNAAKSLPEFVSSEQGMLAGLASLTPLGKAGVTAYFTLDMAKSVLDQAKQAGGDWDKMTVPQKASAITQAVATLGFTALLAKSGIGEIKGALPNRPGAAPEVQGPLATGELLKMPEGSTVPPKVPFNLPDAALPAPEPPVVAPNGVDHEALRSETTESIIARTEPGDQRDAAFSQRASSTREVSASLKPGDVIIDEDGVRRVVADVTGVKIGKPTLWVYEEGTAIGPERTGFEWALEITDKIERGKPAPKAVSTPPKAESPPVSPAANKFPDFQEIVKSNDVDLQPTKRLFGQKSVAELARSMTEEQLKQAESFILEDARNKTNKVGELKKQLSEGNITPEQFLQQQLDAQSTYGKGKIFTDVFSFLERPLPELPKAAAPPAPADVPAGKVRVYSGGRGSSFYTTNLERAQAHAQATGGSIHTLDLDKADFNEAATRAKESGSGTSGDALLTNDQVKLAKEFNRRTVPKVWGLDEQVEPKPAAPAAPPAEPTPTPAAAPERGRINDWITKLESLKSKGGEAGLASFPDPEVFKGIGSALRNTAIDVAIGVLKAGKSIGEALDAAVAHIRERSKDFDEVKLRAALGAYLNPPETTGIAHRVSEDRGMAPERGQGVAPAESVEHGRELLQQGLDPQSVLDVFNKTQAVRADDMAVVRAHLERLSKATNEAADAHGVDSPEYKAAWESEKDWRAKVKPMQTEWHRIGQAQQGETAIDTGTFTGLQRVHQENTGTDFTPGQKKQGQRIAKANKAAQDAAKAAQDKFNQHLVAKTTGMTEAEQRAKQAVFDVHRNIAIDMANAEKKARVADEVYKQALAKIQADAVSAAQGKVTDVKTRAAIDRARAESEARVDAAKRAKDLSDVEVARVKKAQDAVTERARKAAIASAEKARKMQGDPILRVWTKAKEYLDKGIDKFDDIRKKLATDLGMSIEQVTRLMQQDKQAKYLSDDLWRRQQIERNLKSQAKRWVQNLSTPGLTKALQSIPRGMFVLKVGLHGTVALGTHAPTVLFQPRFWNAYVRNFVKMYKMVGSRAYYESQVQNLLRSDNYTTARRAGLVNDPFVYEEYAMNPVVGGVARIAPKLATAINNMTGMGNRGYSVLKILRQDMFDQHWNQLPKSSQIPEMAKAIADGVNHATGVVQGMAPPGTSLALFAPRLEASRVMWLAGDPIRATGTLLNWKNASQGEKYFAMNQLKEKAWVVGTFGSLLALNQGILSATGSNQKVNVTDPFKPDFLKFKMAGMSISYGNPMITMARLPLRLFVGIANEGKFNKIVYEDENVATILFEYVRSQMSPFSGTATDLAIGRDFMRKPLPRAAFGLLPGKTNIPKRLKAEGIQPYTWKEYTAQQAAMIPLQEALKEVWGKDLMMTPEARKHALDALATIIVMGGTGARMSEDYSLKQKPSAPPPWESFR